MAKAGTLTITIDISGIRRAFRQITERINYAFELFTPTGRLRSARRRIGGMGTDARVHPGQWQSTICAGLLCSIAPCPSNAHGLGCTCRCHGGSR